MVHEFAIDPEVLNNWKDFRFFWDQCGYSHGRLIVGIPTRKTWGELVWASCSSETPKNKLRIQEKLRSLKSRVIGSEQQCQVEGKWVDAALSAHQRKSLSGIITTATNMPLPVIESESITNDNSPWCVPRGRRFDKCQDGLLEVVGPLLEYSAEITFVDQWFRPIQRYSDPFRALLRQAKQGVGLVKVEYHLNSSSTNSCEWTAAEFRDRLNQQRTYWDLANIPKLTFIRWREGADNMHGRYLLTNRVGVMFHHGFDDGLGTNDAVILDNALWKECLEKYKPDSSELDFVDAWQVTENEVYQVSFVRGQWRRIVE